MNVQQFKILINTECQKLISQMYQLHPICDQKLPLMLMI